MTEDVLFDGAGCSANPVVQPAAAQNYKGMR